MRVILFPDLKKVYGIPYSDVHIRRLQKQDAFPQNIKLGGGGGSNRNGWFETEIQAWLEKKAAERKQPEPANAA